MFLDQANDYWNIVICSDETKIELLGPNQQFLFRVKRTAHYV